VAERHLTRQADEKRILHRILSPWRGSGDPPLPCARRRLSQAAANGLIAEAMPTRKIAIFREFRGDTSPPRRAETAAVRMLPGKKFLVSRERQASVNQSCLAWPLARRRAILTRLCRPQFFRAFCPADCVRHHASGIVMAAKNETSTETGDAEAAEKQAPPAKRRPPFKLIIMAAAGIVGVGVLGVGGYTLLSHRGPPTPVVAQVKPPVFIDMPDVLVNLSASGADRIQYLKVKIALELPDAAVSAQIRPIMPRLLDTFQTYLRELRPTDLDGSAGLYRLKEELTRRVNAAIAPNRINAVLFKEIVVQ
jgi:flagellar FliL protein